MTTRKPRILAVIELGTTSIRMVLGQAGAAGHVQVLDELEHSVSLGHDVLTAGLIGPDVTELCVSALRSFRRVLEEYRVAERNIRIVATSAVREAQNRDSFADRILVATGFDVEVIDQAEVSRLTYRAVQPKLRREPFFRKSDVFVVEVGGGSTETLLFRKGKVSSAHMYRLGSLRVRTLLEDQDVPLARFESLMRDEVAQTLSQVNRNVMPLSSPQIVLLGSDARFACSTLGSSRECGHLCELSRKKLKKFMRSIITRTVDDVAKEYELNYTEAETLGPSLFIAVALAQALKLKHVMVGDATLRTGILSEMATGEKWTREFRRQVINSALAIRRKYGGELRHARHVASYGLQIINTLRERYDISERDDVIFHVAALLHDIGESVNTASHHKHSRYLILNSDVFGLGRRDITLAALVARYHRGAEPKPSHEDYMDLDRMDRITVSKLAAVIRVANALDRLRFRRALHMDMSIDGNSFTIQTSPDQDLSPIQPRIQDRSRLFASVFGKQVKLRTRRT